jgi:hypothetical protein
MTTAISSARHELPASKIRNLSWTFRTRRRELRVRALIASVRTGSAALIESHRTPRGIGSAARNAARARSAQPREIPPARAKRRDQRAGISGAGVSAQRISTGGLYAETCAPSETLISARYRPRWTRTTRLNFDTVAVPVVTTVPPLLTE